MFEVMKTNFHNSNIKSTDSVVNDEHVSEVRESVITERKTEEEMKDFYLNIYNVTGLRVNRH